MTRGRHRHHFTPAQAVPAVTVGTLATAGVVLAVVNGDLQVLRMAVIASWVVALGMAGVVVRRTRTFARESALVDSARRREESQFAEQLGLLQTSIAGLQEQLERLNTESSELRAEVGQLRADKAEADEIVRRAREERARAQAAEREAADQRLLTAAAFEAAAAVLENFGSGSRPVDQAAATAGEPDWITAWVASLGSDDELDLTPHDDTIQLQLEAAPAAEPVSLSRTA